MRSEKAILVDKSIFDTIKYTPNSGESDKITDNYDMFWKRGKLILEQNDVKKYNQNKEIVKDQLNTIKDDLNNDPTQAELVTILEKLTDLILIQ